MKFAARVFLALLLTMLLSLAMAVLLVLSAAPAHAQTVAGPACWPAP